MAGPRIAHALELVEPTAPFGDQVLAVDPLVNARGTWRFVARGRDPRTGETYYVWRNGRNQLCARPVARFWAGQFH